MTHQQATYIKDEHLPTYAADCAHRLKLSGRIRGKTAAQQLRQNLRELEQLHAAAARQRQSLAATPGALRWLLDNHYLAAREGADALDALLRCKELRVSGHEALLLYLSRHLLQSSAWQLQEERMALFLRGFQRAIILRPGELGLLPFALRWAIIEQLTLRCRRAAQEQDWSSCEGFFAAAFSSLRLLATTDLSPLLEQADFVERCYRQDPAGIYPLMDQDSRAYYRSLTTQLARQRGISEDKAARLVLSLAKKGKDRQSHVGYWLLHEPLGTRPPSCPAGIYVAATVLLTLFFSLLFAFLCRSPSAFFLLLLPISELVKNLLDLVMQRRIPPRQLPRLALKEGLPKEGRSLCVISCLLTGEQDIAALCRRLEESWHCSRDCDRELRFALLADLPDTLEEPLPDAAAWLEQLRDGINTLNKRYSNAFYLLTRPRVKTTEGRWMGWERKRGALWECMCWLRGENSSIVCTAGKAEDLRDTQYLLALDSDTLLPPEAAHSLIAAALHPLNVPLVDLRRRVVTAGHGILSPRLSVSLPDATANNFTRLYAPPGGSDPYQGACPELYMDSFASGGFAGKGLIHIDSFLICLRNRIPPGRVLSHDALEGAFLRAGYDSVTELLEAFPSSLSSYLKRQHRWIRGDWQNLPWLFARGRDLPEIERFRLLDSLRRSLVPPMTFAALCLALLLPCAGTVLAAALGLTALGFPCLSAGFFSLFLPLRDSRHRFFSPVFAGFGGQLVKSLLRLLFLPMEAYVSADALFRALWRMYRSGKKLLQWQTAGQSEGPSRPLRALLRLVWPASLLLLILLVFGGILGKSAALLWLASPLFALQLSRPRRASPTPSPAQHAYLLHCARDTWRFFEDFLSPDDNYLPPDNFQQRPAVGLAHRTSPTNIGLALLSLLAARDLELCEESDFLHRCGEMLRTVEALPKWQGHLYNWYDTQTLRPLPPRYVSTVDSGNLYACLTALEAGLREHKAPDLARRCRALMAPMDFRPLYHESRGLFHIGLDVDKQELSTSFYDLFSSEARLTAYCAIARGDIPRRCWRRLSRAMVEKNVRRGMASWTGTMFEYLMPELLLPLYRESLLYESARFCLYVQRRRHRPWGISESGYASLDASMSYRYKAHGCAALALKSDMDAETVISPYSSFLALPLNISAVVENLRQLEAMGMRGDYGFWEALDLIPLRHGAVVRSVMAHHQGMSMLAIANCLCGGCMQRRFFADPAMWAHRVLLQEKLPLGAAVLRRKNLPIPQRPRPFPAEEELPWQEGVDVFRPAVTALAGELCTLTVSESGRCQALWGKLSPYLPSEGPLDEQGSALFLRVGEDEYDLLPSPYATAAARRRCRLGSSEACFQSVFPSLQAELCLSLPRDEVGEQRRVTLSWTGERTPAELVFRFTPLLASYPAYRSHPAFAKLGLCAQLHAGKLLVKRLPRGAQGALYLAMGSDLPCRFDNVPGAISGRNHRCRALTETPFYFTEPLCECRVPLQLEPGQSLSCTFALGCGHSAAAALSAADHCLGLSADQRADLPRRAAAVLGMSGELCAAARTLLSFLCYPSAPISGPQARHELWKHGISGDRPILCAEYSGEEQLPAARQLLDCYLYLSACGMEHDLVFITHDAPSYFKPLNDAVNTLLWHNGGELLAGRDGGVHVVSHSDGAEGLRACAALVLPLSSPLSLPPRDTRPPLSRPARQWMAELPELRFREDSFHFLCRRALPPRAWSLLLSNGRLGFLATDCGSGNLWYLNARENPITPWENQPLATAGPERLELCQNGTRHSLFASPDGGSCLVSFRPGLAQWEKHQGSAFVRTSCFIPPHSDVRIFLLESRGFGDDAYLHWEIPLQLAPQAADGRFVQTAQREGLFLARSDRSMAAARPFLALSSVPPVTFTCDADAAARGEYSQSCGRHSRSVFAMKLPLKERLVLVCGCEGEERLRALADPAAALRAREETQAFWRKALPFTLRCPDAALSRLCSGWLGYQTLCCRLMGRSSLYQSGGAYGFRDQLQDAVNLLLLDSRYAREQLLRCASHQYREGDVQHWWHEGSREPRGVRTRCSDDLLWLPWALCEYVEKTGDLALCEQEIPYLLSPPLAEQERDRYEAAESTPERDSLLRHGQRAMELVLQRGCGPHGLLLMGSGDWNDGFDRVEGESVWLTWFFCQIAPRFAALLDGHNTPGAAHLRQASQRLLAAAEQSWDGEWYRRAYYADGRTLGSAADSSCRIDSIAQSFAAFCPGADPQRVDKALHSAVEALYDRELGLLRLFTPPFTDRGTDPGYLLSYGPGFRENGGQYTHAAVWLVMALLRRERQDEAWELLQALLPEKKDPAVYGLEPFVIAADVYTAPGHEGEGGWSWYTGAAGWLLRLVMEELLGLRLQEGKLRISPRLPTHWSGCTIDFRGHRIVMEGGSITVDGKAYHGEELNW